MISRKDAKPAKPNTPSDIANTGSNGPHNSAASGSRHLTERSSPSRLQTRALIYLLDRLVQPAQLLAEARLLRI